MGGMLTFISNLLCEDLGAGRSAPLFQMTLLHNQPHLLPQVTHVKPWILLRWGPNPSSLQMASAAGTKAEHLRIGDVRSEHSPLPWMWESGSRCALATVMNCIRISSQIPLTVLERCWLTDTCTNPPMACAASPWHDCKIHPRGALDRRYKISAPPAAGAVLAPALCPSRVELEPAGRWWPPHTHHAHWSTCGRCHERRQDNNMPESIHQWEMRAKAVSKM